LGRQKELGTGRGNGAAPSLSGGAGTVLKVYLGGNANLFGFYSDLGSALEKED